MSGHSSLYAENIYLAASREHRLYRNKDETENRRNLCFVSFRQKPPFISSLKMPDSFMQGLRHFSKLLACCCHLGNGGRLLLC